MMSLGDSMWPWPTAGRLYIWRMIIMIGKMKGCAALTVLAGICMAASVSPASAEFHSEGFHTIYTGSQVGTHALSFDPGTVDCKVGTLSGTSTTTTTREITFTEVWKECTLTSIFGNIAVTVNMNECDLLTTTINEVHILCPAGKSISISGPGCSITIPGGQTVLGITFTNLGSGSTREILKHTNVTGTAYSYTGFTCGSGSGTKNGTVNGTTLITGVDTAGAHLGIWHQV